MGNDTKTDEDEKRATSTYIRPSVHKALKIMATIRDQQISDYLEKIILEKKAEFPESVF